MPKERIHQYGLKDNFWQMGETGPCGPCSEIFYDMGIEAAETPESTSPSATTTPATSKSGTWSSCSSTARPLWTRPPRPPPTSSPRSPSPPSIPAWASSVLAAVLQGKVSNFETDLFTPLIDRAAELTGLVVGPGFSPDNETDHDDRALAPAVGVDALKGTSFSPYENDIKKDGALAPEGIAALVSNASLRIIADHARAATFLINDGVLPSNEGRGYVLRKILRRGIRHGRLLGQEQPFLYEMVYAVRDLMQGAYPELNDSAARVAKVVEAEEKQFDRVLGIGAEKLDAYFRESLLLSEEDLVNDNLVNDFVNSLPATSPGRVNGELASRFVEFLQDASLRPWEATPALIEEFVGQLPTAQDDFHHKRDKKRVEQFADFAKTAPQDSRKLLTGGRIPLLRNIRPAARLHGRRRARCRCRVRSSPASSAPAPKNKPAPAPVGKAAAKNPPALPSASCRRRTSTATSSSSPPTPKSSPS